MTLMTNPFCSVRIVVTQAVLHVVFPAAPGQHGWYLPSSPPLLASYVATTCLTARPLECWHPKFIPFIRRPSNQTNHTKHTQSGVCASSATREEKVSLCLHMQVHHIDNLVNPYSIVCLSLSFHSYYACFIFTCAVLCSMYFSCPSCHQSHQLGCNKHSNSDPWPV